MKSMQNFVESPKLIFKIFFAKNVPYEPLLRARGSSKLESDVGAEVARWIQMESDVRWSQMESDVATSKLESDERWKSFEWHFF